MNTLQILWHAAADTYAAAGMLYLGYAILRRLASWAADAQSTIAAACTMGATTMREVTLRTRLSRALRARGARPIKYHGSIYSEAGIPDLLVCYRGRFVFIETKMLGEKPTQLQEHRMTELRAAGAVGGLAYSVEHGLKYLDFVDANLLTPAKPSANMDPS